MLGESTLKDSIVKAVDELVNIKKHDNDTIYIEEVTTCLRRSYYNRKEERVPLKEGFKIFFNEYMRYNTKSGIREYGEEGLGFKIITKADMVVDDAIIHFNIVDDLPNTPYPKDLMVLNANLWIFNKEEGALVYITKDGNNIQFSLRGIRGYSMRLREGLLCYIHYLRKGGFLYLSHQKSVSHAHTMRSVMYSIRGMITQR